MSHDYVIRQGSIQINSLEGNENIFLTVDSNGLIVTSGFTSGSFITPAQLAPITAAFQSQIDEEGAINTLQSVQIAGITATYTPLTTTAAISAYLQSQLDSLPVSSTIANITAHIADIEVVNSLQSTAIQSLSAADVVFDGRISSLEDRVTDVEIVNALQSAAIQAISGDDSAIQSQVDAITGRLLDVEIVNGLQSTAIQSLSASESALEVRVTDVEVVNGLQSTAIQSLSAADSAFDIRITDVETVNGLQSAAIQSLSASNDVLQTQVNSITGRLTSVENRVTDVEVVNGLQSLAIADLSGQVLDLEIVNGLQSAAIQDISATYTPLATTASISAYLQGQLNNLPISSVIADITATNALQSTQIQSITANYTTLAQTASLTGQLQTQISDVVTDLATNYYDKPTSDSLFVHLVGTETISGEKTFIDNVVILGSLTVAGSATFLNTSEVLVKDNFITLNSNVTAGAPVLDAGINVSRGNQPKAEIRWNETTDQWTIGIEGDDQPILTPDNAGAYLDSRFVNITGDTMTGTLHITGANLEIVGGELKVDNATIKYGENTQVDIGTELIDAFDNTIGNGAMWTVSVRNGLNVRTSQVIGCWVGSSVEYTEVSTLDIGDTSGLVLIVDNNVGSNGLIRLQATATSNGWVVKSIRTVL